MAGYANAYRIRLGDYRVLFEIHDQVLLLIVLKVADRKEAYRGVPGGASRRPISTGRLQVQDLTLVRPQPPRS